MNMTRRITAALASSRGLFVSALLAGGIFGAGFLGVGDTSHVVTAQFRDADGLVVGNEVRGAGVAAGSVTSIDIKADPSSGQFIAQVDMNIDATQWPLHQGTSVAVKPKGVLSNVFVELDPGPMANPSLGDHPFFPVGQTQSPVSLNELNNVFSQSVREAIRTQLQEGVLAFGGAGAADLNATLVNANPLTLDAIPVTAVLATRSPQLDALNFEFDTISGDLAREDSNLRPLIANLDTTLGALAVQEVNLQGTLVHAANVFGDLSGALSSPTTQADLARIFQEGPQSLNCAAAIANYLTPLINTVNPYVSHTAPYSLDTLLADFVTASGFNVTTPLNHAPYSGDALRVNPVDDFSFYTIKWKDTGGLTAAHAGYTNSSAAGQPVYEEQPPLTRYPTLSGCTPPSGLP